MLDSAGMEASWGRSVEGPDKRTEFHDRFVAIVDDRGGITLRRSATLWFGRHP
jgi:hypothetical protein